MRDLRLGVEDKRGSEEESSEDSNREKGDA